MVEKRTVLGRMRMSIAFSERTQIALSSLHEAWFVDGSGTQFFSEFRGTWRSVLLETADPEVRSFFADLGLGDEQLPRLEVEDEYAGSWIVDVAIVMAGTVGTAYTVLKGVSELPEIADGLTSLKRRILRQIEPRVEQEARARLQQVTRGQSIPDTPIELPPPGSLLDVDLVIDARPVANLQPAQLKRHAVHLGVGISRDVVTIENLGDEAITNLRLGLFYGRTERHEWRFAEAYSASVDILSARQTISKSISDFCNTGRVALDLPDADPVFVDCWVQDQHGIYLFNFLLEEE